MQVCEVGIKEKCTHTHKASGKVMVKRGQWWEGGDSDRKEGKLQSLLGPKSQAARNAM